MGCISVSWVVCCMTLATSMESYLQMLPWRGRIPCCAWLLNLLVCLAVAGDTGREGWYFKFRLCLPDLYSYTFCTVLRYVSSDMKPVATESISNFGYPILYFATNAVYEPSTLSGMVAVQYSGTVANNPLASKSAVTSKLHWELDLEYLFVVYGGTFYIIRRFLFIKVKNILHLCEICLWFRSDFEFAMCKLFPTW